MTEAIRHVDATYERFDVEISYTCPRCGTKRHMSPSPSDIYWMLECGKDAECENCGAKFYVWGENEP